MSTTSAAIVARFPELFPETLGDLIQSVTAIVSPENAKPTQMCFLATPKAIAAGFASEATTFVLPWKAKAQAELHAKTQPGKTFLFSTHPEKAMALVINEFFRETPYTNPSIRDIHPTAIIDSSAKVSATARIAPHAFIGAGVTIGDNAYIGMNSVIEDFSSIGADTVIHPNVFIGHRTEIGARCEVHPSTVIAKEGFGYAHDERFNHTRIPHQGRVVLEDDVHIGACCTIDRATFGETRLEKGIIMDNLVHIAHNCRIGRNSVLTSGFTMAGSSKIGANFVAGGKTVVTGHIEVTDNVQVAALSAISKSVPVPGSYGGHPLQPLQQYLKAQSTIGQLPQMRKLLTKIAKHLKIELED